MLNNFKKSKPQQFSFLILIFLFLYFVVPEDENSLLWRLPPLLKDIPVFINYLLDNLMFNWLTIPVYDPDWDMYEDQAIVRLITRSISDFLEPGRHKIIGSSASVYSFLNSLISS